MSWTKKFFCPVNGWDCPYFNKDGSCAMVEDGDDPVFECDDAASYYNGDDDYFVWEDEYGNRFDEQELLEMNYHIVNDVPMKMEENKMHISCIPDGSFVTFPNSAIRWLKVCDSYDGRGGVVDIQTGRLIMVSELEKNGLNPYSAEITNESIWGVEG